MEKVYGIDLGTTYSCIAYVDENGKPVVLKNMEGDLTTPSVVHFESDADIHVGKAAKDSAMLFPDEVVSCIKAYMGEPNGSREINGKTMRPEEISSYILKKVVDDAQMVLEEEQKLEPGEEVKKVVITCPAYFGVAEREATKAAGKIAGLEVLDIINEPTAAAIAYGTIDDSTEKTVLVYDLGGGTFDVTMIHVKPGDIRVVCTGGDKNLGGKDWDEAIVEYLADVYQEETNSFEDIRDDEETLQDLYIAVENAKKLLSSRDKTPIAVNYKGERVRVDLTREKFDELTKILLNRTIDLTKEMFAEAEKKGYKQSDISEILLVGGSSYMPQVEDRVKAEFGLETKRFDPNQAVAKGAAVYAANRQTYSTIIKGLADQSGKSESEIEERVASGKINLEDAAENIGLGPAVIGSLPTQATKITNVSSRSFGVVALIDGQNERLINMILKNADLPAEGKQMFSPAEDGQTSAYIEVKENLSSDEYTEVSSGRTIGDAVLELSPNSSRSDEIEMVFHLDESGLLEVKAKDLKSGKHVEASFQIEGAMSENDIDSAAQSLQAAKVD